MKIKVLFFRKEPLVFDNVKTVEVTDFFNLVITLNDGTEKFIPNGSYKSYETL